jgi:hypothetical protein
VAIVITEPIAYFGFDSIDYLVPVGYQVVNSFFLALPHPPGPRNAGGLPFVIGKSVGVRLHLQWPPKQARLGD